MRILLCNTKPKLRHAQAEHDAQEMDVDEAAQPPEQRGPLADLAQADVPDKSSAAAAQGDSAQQAPEADEQVSDTDDDDEGRHSNALVPRPYSNLLCSHCSSPVHVHH